MAAAGTEIEGVGAVGQRPGLVGGVGDNSRIIKVPARFSSRTSSASALAVERLLEVRLPLISVSCMAAMPKKAMAKMLNLDQNFDQGGPPLVCFLTPLLARHGSFPREQEWLRRFLKFQNKLLSKLHIFPRHAASR